MTRMLRTIALIPFFTVAMVSTLVGDLDNQHDHKIVDGFGARNQVHASEILPDAIRWLWRDWKEQTP